jgi:hypothetical protein
MGNHNSSFKSYFQLIFTDLCIHSEESEQDLFVAA